MMSGIDIHTLARASTATVTALLTTVVVTAFMVVYARGSGMLDHPGQRRSHESPTPRGGGLGLVLGSLAGMTIALTGMLRPPALLWTFVAAGLVVALVGWMDDRRGLSILPRIVAHFLAACGFSLMLVLAAHWPLWVMPPMVLVAMWSINLHNFMDGIDGLLGMQLLFVGLLSAALCVFEGLPVLATANLALSAAATGFLVFNLPPARIFMGDVGSGFAGLLVFMLGALWCAVDTRALWPLLIMHAGFFTDASLTLSSRMLRGRRWYTPHREHLYQWLVRRKYTHGQITCLYFGYNIVLIAPAAGFAVGYPGVGPYLCVVVYLLSAIFWWSGKARCLDMIRQGGAHART